MYGHSNLRIPSDFPLFLRSELKVFRVSSLGIELSSCLLICEILLLGELLCEISLGLPLGILIINYKVTNDVIV